MRRILIVFLALLLAGCGTYNLGLLEEEANASVFQNGKEILETLQSFKADIDAGRTISREEVHRRLRVSEDEKNIERIRSEEIPTLLFSKNFVTSDSNLLASIKRDYTAEVIPFQHVKNSAVLSFPFHVTTYRTGYDIRLVIVYYKGRLTSTDHFGTARIDRATKRLLLNPISVAEQSLENKTTLPGRCTVC